jgi:hypothetical protein
MAIHMQDIELVTNDHVVHFYEHDAELVGAVVPYLAEAARADEVAIVIATEAHRHTFQAELEANGVDLIEVGDRLLWLDAATTLAAFTLDGQIDRDAFHEVIGALVRTAAESGRAIRAYGEMVALLWDDGQVLAAVELETLWNELAHELPFSLFCAYPTASVSGSEQAEALRHVCQLHSYVHGPMAEADERSADPGFESAVAIEVAAEFPVQPIEVTAEFPAERDSPGRARRLVVAALREWGYDRELLDDVALVVTELASNAVLHAGTRFSVSVRTRDSMLRVAVGDGVPPQATARDGGLIKRPQHGLDLIDALATSWGVERVSGGKVVWAELPEL